MNLTSEVLAVRRTKTSDEVGDMCGLVVICPATGRKGDRHLALYPERQ